MTHFVLIYYIFENSIFYINPIYFILSNFHCFVKIIFNKKNGKVVYLRPNDFIIFNNFVIKL